MIIHSKNTVVLSDTHFPFQDNTAIKKALVSIIIYKPDLIILNGDIVDFYALSKYSKKPSMCNLKNEIDTTKEFFKALRTKFKKRIIFKPGNHENRLCNYILNHAAMFEGLTSLSLSSLLDLNKYGVEYAEDVIRVGDLNVIHGHESGNICSAYPAKSLYLVAKTNCLAGHCHRQSSFVTRTICGDIIRTYTTGCLSILTPDYSKHNDWTHGIALIETHKGKSEVTLKSY